MARHWSIALLCVGLLGAMAPGPGSAAEGTNRMTTVKTKPVTLPPPERHGTMPLEQALATRRTLREYSDAPLTERELSQLMWAAQGITAPGGLRTAPSAGALYPLELYLATEHGFYHYEPATHALTPRSDFDLRRALRVAALGQEPVSKAPAVFVIAAVFERTAHKYGPARAPRFVHLEAGHAAQNLLLEATALGLGGVPVGAFDDTRVCDVLGLPAGQEPLYLIPVGRPR